MPVQVLQSQITTVKSDDDIEAVVGWSHGRLGLQSLSQPSSTSPNTELKLTAVVPAHRNIICFGYVLFRPTLAAKLSRLGVVASRVAPSLNDDETWTTQESVLASMGDRASATSAVLYMTHFVILCIIDS